MPLSYAALLSGRAGRGPKSARHIMASYTTSEIRGGLKVLLDGDPYTVIENEFVKPGKGQAFNRIKVRDRKSTRLNSSHLVISYAVFCLKKKKKYTQSVVRVPPTLVTLLPYTARLDHVHINR